MPPLIEGYWFEEGSAARITAVLRIDNEHYTVLTSTQAPRQGLIRDIDISDRLGNVERVIKLEDGSVFVTKDNDAVDEAFKNCIKTNLFVHAIESSFGWVLIALVVTCISAFSFFKWGVPWTSTAIAQALPQKTNELIGANTLEFLDDYIFEESALNDTQMDSIRQHFLTKLMPLEKQRSDINYTLHFRSWEMDDKSIPNALALPSGDIILTDKFVELSENQDEIDSVILHEMGHVVHRHTLETIIQGTLVTTAIMLTTGDLSSAADMGVGLGSLLLSTNYSRQNESEADQYAFEKMLIGKINPDSFSSIMARISNYDNKPAVNSSPNDDNEPSVAVNNKPPLTQDSATNADENTILDYLSTHPSTAGRIKQAEIYAQCYRQGLTVCNLPQTQ